MFSSHSSSSSSMATASDPRLRTATLLSPSFSTPRPSSETLPFLSVSWYSGVRWRGCVYFLFLTCLPGSSRANSHLFPISSPSLPSSSASYSFPCPDAYSPTYLPTPHRLHPLHGHLQACHPPRFRVLLRHRPCQTHYAHRQGRQGITVYGAFASAVLLRFLAASFLFTFSFFFLPSTTMNSCSGHILQRRSVGNNTGRLDAGTFFHSSVIPTLGLTFLIADLRT
jgi:hypothetical protein